VAPETAAATNGPTGFDELLRLEPRLGALVTMCRSAAPPAWVRDDDEDNDSADDGGWCVEDFFFRRVKPRLQSLVGWGREAGPPSLRGDTAYRVAYRYLYGLLPFSCACCRELNRG
jgi:hypothetical protein